MKSLRPWDSPRAWSISGAKKIYVYPDLKVTFNGGKVSDVQ